MDAAAITNAQDELLKEMGLSKAGDRLSLKGFCARQKDETVTGGNNERKRALLEAFLSRKKEKKKPESTSINRSSHPSIKKPEKLKTKKVQLGWKHWKEQEQVYVLVPLVKGGGSRVVEMTLDSNKMDLYKACKNLFFPEGRSIFGNEDDMIFDLTNFKDEKIETTIKVGKEDLPFNLCNYMEVHKLKSVRIYLQSKIIGGSDDEENDASSSLFEESSLIGSTQERQSILFEQEREYGESLNADEKKAVSMVKETSDIERKKRVQRARTDRVLPEPNTNFVTVKVRHLTMGLQSRRFPGSACMSAVYDWAGSLNSDPENFTLCDHFGVLLQPSCGLSDKCTISMVEDEHRTPAMSESDDEVQFLGFGDSSTICKPTLADADKSSKQYKEDLVLFDVKDNNEETSV